METKANYVIVGIFTTAAIIAAFLFVYWTATVGDRGETAMLRVRIPGSASGLGRGSAVLFNGIKVGDVRRVYLDVENPTVVIADTEIDRLTPITRSTQVDIGLAGLTGQANIELKGADPKEPRLLDEAEATGQMAQVTANPSAVTNLLQTAQDIFTRADNVLSELEGFTRDVRGPLTETVANAKTFSDALARNAEGVDKFLESVASLSEELAGVSGKLDGTLRAAEELLRSVDGQKVARIVDNVETFTRSLSETSAQLEGVIASVDGTVKAVEKFAQDADRTLGRVEQVIATVDPEAVRRTLESIASVSEKADGIATDVARVTEKLGGRSGEIDSMVAEASQLIARLNEASVRVESVFAKVDELVGSGRVDDIIANVDTTLKSFGAFATDAGRTLGRVDEIVASADPDVLRKAFEDIARAGETADRIASDVAKVTDRFGQRADDVDQMISDARDLTRRLSEASVRVDGILARVDGLLGSGEAEGVMSEASETLKAFRQVADTLNARLGTITEGLARFSGDGLREIEALARDSRRSVGRIESAITDLSRNPQRILSGGEGTVRQYDGRTRR